MKRRRRQPPTPSIFKTLECPVWAKIEHALDVLNFKGPPVLVQAEMPGLGSVHIDRICHGDVIFLEAQPLFWTQDSELKLERIVLAATGVRPTVTRIPDEPGYEARWRTA